MRYIASIERLFRVFTVLGVEIVLTLREPLSETKRGDMTKHQNASLPKKLEYW